MPKGGDKEEQRCYLKRGVRALCAQNDTYNEAAKLFSLEQSGPGLETDAHLYCPSLGSLQTLTTLLPLHTHWFTLLFQLSTISLTLSF